MFNFFNILSCSTNGTNCCSDYKLVNMLYIFHKVLRIFQIIVPIILIIMISIQLVKMIMNPDAKKGSKSILNRVIAATIVFLLPSLVNIVFSIIPANIQLSSCWKEATAAKSKMGSYVSNSSQNDSNSSTTSNTVSKKNLSTSEKRLKSKKTQPNKKKSKKKTKSKKSVNAVIARNRNQKQKSLKHKTVGSEKGKKLVNYAKKFVGNRYCWGGNNPNKCADCSGFVGYVFKHFGISLPRKSISIPNTSAKYKKVTNGKVKAGDIIVYNSGNGQGHVAIATGKGDQIIHASNERTGITYGNSYKTGGTGKITIMRLDKIN